MSQWYLLYTKPRQELTAVTNLENQQYRVFCPRVEVKKRTAQGWKVVSEPLFPNYVFICLNDTTDNWKPIRSTIGVSGFVRFGSGLPVAMDEASMIALQSLNLNQLSDTLTQYPKAGDRVLVGIGDSLVNALVQAADGKGRVQVLLQLLGQDQTLWIESSAIQLLP
jgi:transcriptional antiterminator RfaH